MKYIISSDYIPKPSKRRSGRFIDKVTFLVAHDTGNPSSTAQNNVDYYKRTCDVNSASAHIFVDDKHIIECIPAFIRPEKAWHVLYNTPVDNTIFGDDANDRAIGVEYCFGNNINADKAYKRYVWILAYLCYYYKLNPINHIVAHSTLDPKNKIDPQNGLSYSNRTFGQLIDDCIKEYNSINEKGDEMMAGGMFKDIPDNDYAKKAIEKLGEMGIVKGDGKGAFSPDKPITRRESMYTLYTTLVKLGIVKEDD